MQEEDALGRPRQAPEYWYKGLYAGAAPIWIADPEGECWVHPRGVLGHILLAPVELIVQTMNLILSALDDTYEPGFPLQYDDRQAFTPFRE